MKISKKGKISHTYFPLVLLQTTLIVICLLGLGFFIMVSNDQNKKLKVQLRDLSNLVAQIGAGKFPLTKEGGPPAIPYIIFQALPNLSTRLDVLEGRMGIVATESSKFEVK